MQASYSSESSDWVHAEATTSQEWTTGPEYLDNTTDRNRADPTADPEPDYATLLSYPEETDYYALLGLSRTPPPSDAEIRSAYKNLTLSFHPDKQPGEWQEIARRHFERIREAYDTLIDHRKRTVYDLLGAEGVQAEWGPGGSMGRGGEAERERRVGVRARSPEEFRRWFLEAMKRRERKAINSMVQSRGSIVLGIDASDMISVDEDEGEVYVNVPSAKPSKFNVGYTFKAPLPTPRKLLGKLERDEPVEEGAEQQEAEAEDGDEPEMVINAGISGEMRHMAQKLTIEHTDGTTEIRKVPLPPIIASQEITLGASVNHVFGDVASQKGILSKRPFSFLRYSAVSVGAMVLPVPSVQANMVKAFTPVAGTKPFNVNFSSSFYKSPVKCPPAMAVQVMKEVGDRKHAFCRWQSGTISWPGAVERLLSPFLDIGLDVDSAFTIPKQISQFQIGLLSLPKSHKQAAFMDDYDEQPEGEEEESEYQQLRSKQRAEDKVGEAWQIGFSVSPEASGLQLSYARNLFSGTAANDPVRSEWSSEGHYALPPANEPRSIRVEVASTVNMDMSLSWKIEGSRQVGELTRMGLGVGVEGPHGLVMTVSWSRLGQKIKLPIAVCPIDMVNADAAALAIIFPWVAYCAWEFGFIRPRERKNRRRVIARRQKELKKLVPIKRAESLQATELMTEQVRRRQAKEERQDGLVITKAEYGHYPSKKKGNDVGKEYEVVDVTIPVAGLVDRSQLVIPKNMVKFHILGFYDPAPLLPKTLKIWYTYHGAQHYVEATDSEAIACPMRTHLMADEI
ncbi:DnaJ domain protein [Aspergillus flavus]|uniref:DnaJ domain protein n=1 Tax=Aspergillus flavus TaxID=5059 RepID=A0AB74CHK0_ASPFL|nr:DnaJ domain protein [Aspergillus flavus]